MDTLVRTIAIIVEVLLLGVIAYSVLNGVRMAALDLGIKAKYNRMITLVMLVIGIIVLTFFVAHLVTFYPAVE
jgi:hypothetical protein